jgi:F420-dependent oxidoreductase-like protein
MKIGLQIPNYKWQGSPDNLGSKLSQIAHTADAVGFASIWVMDHLFQIEIPGLWSADDPMLESYSALTFMAGATRTARLGALVTAVTYREPGLLVKTVSALDVLSGGRAYLGIGAGWYEREADGLGLRFAPLKDRFERLEETLQIAKQMWSGDRTPFNGTHYHLAEPINSPQPRSSPHPPILIGGGGEQKTLRLVAQYGDACNLFPASNEELAHKLDVLKRHCDDVGRDYDQIERTLLLPALPAAPGGIATSELIQGCRNWASLGFGQVILSDVPGIADITPLEVIGREVIPAVADL